MSHRLSDLFGHLSNQSWYTHTRYINISRFECVCVCASKIKVMLTRTRNPYSVTFLRPTVLSPPLNRLWGIQTKNASVAAVEVISPPRGGNFDFGFIEEKNCDDRFFLCCPPTEQWTPHTYDAYTHTYQAIRTMHARRIAAAVHDTHRCASVTSSRAIHKAFRCRCAHIMMRRVRAWRRRRRRTPPVRQIVYVGRAVQPCGRRAAAPCLFSYAMLVARCRRSVGRSVHMVAAAAAAAAWIISRQHTTTIHPRARGAQISHQPFPYK